MNEHATVRSYRHASPRRQGMVTFLFALGVLTMILTLGVGSSQTCDVSVQVQGRERYQDIAQNAAMSGIFYGRRRMNEMAFGCNQSLSNCPGDNSPLPAGVWRAEEWMGNQTNPGTHRTWANRKGPDVRYPLPRINGANGAPAAWVYYTLSLNEAIARNNYFYNTEDILGQQTQCCTPVGITMGPAANNPQTFYEPEEVMYTLTSTGEVRYCNPDNGTEANARPIARAEATLTFVLPITVTRIVDNSTGIPVTFTQLTRRYSDLSLEIAEGF